MPPFSKFISVTRLHLRHLGWFPLFAWHAARSRNQAERSPGCLRVALHVEPFHTFWTLTMWESREAMQAYRNQGPHRRAMAAGPRMADALESAHWESDRFPGWPEAMARLHAACGRA